MRTHLAVHRPRIGPLGRGARVQLLQYTGTLQRHHQHVATWRIRALRCNGRSPRGGSERSDATAGRREASRSSLRPYQAISSLKSSILQPIIYGR
eukprot:1182450-Prorocentrum_minimum.AAC.3